MEMPIENYSIIGGNFIERIWCMSREDLFVLVMEQYKKHGNSMNGAQLNIIGNKMDMWIREIGIDETKKLLMEDFDTFHFGRKKTGSEELNILCSIYLDKRENETGEETLERLKTVLDSELCNLADHHISYQIHEVFE